MFSGSFPDNTDQKLSSTAVLQGQISPDRFILFKVTLHSYTEVSLEVPLSFARFLAIVE